MSIGKFPFVADGLRRFVRSPEFRHRRTEIEQQVRANYATRLAATKGFWERKRLEAQIFFEIRRELKKLIPTYALWLTAGH